jgi:hypothetical protein
METDAEAEVERVVGVMRKFVATTLKRAQRRRYAAWWVPRFALSAPVKEQKRWGLDVDEVQDERDWLDYVRFDWRGKPIDLGLARRVWLSVDVGQRDPDR